MNFLKALIALLALGAIGAAAFVYCGVFDAAADVPQWPFVYDLMETTRQRSIAVRAKDIPVPPLDDPKLIADGAEHYSGMCTGCHLAPGISDSEIRPGLYPQPPDFSKPVSISPAEMFWTIKHGIKMSAMPAWGKTHDDDAIWGLVAFIRKLPGMTPEQYKAATGSGGEAGEHHHHHGGDDESGNHEHGHDEAVSNHHHDEAHEHTHGDAPARESISLEGLTPSAVPDAEATAKAFHRALKNGDRKAVLALLAPEVTISEAGHTQSRDEYAAGHLGEDIAFLKDAKIAETSLGSMPMGASAMVGSASTITATEKGKSVTLRSREMLTVKKADGHWLITAVQWESEAAP